MFYLQPRCLEIWSTIPLRIRGQIFLCFVQTGHNLIHTLHFQVRCGHSPTKPLHPTNVRVRKCLFIVESIHLRDEHVKDYCFSILSCVLENTASHSLKGLIGWPPGGIQRISKGVVLSIDDCLKHGQHINDCMWQRNQGSQCGTSRKDCGREQCRGVRNWLAKCFTDCLGRWSTCGHILGTVV